MCEHLGIYFLTLEYFSLKLVEISQKLSLFLYLYLSSQKFSPDYHICPRFLSKILPLNIFHIIMFHPYNYTLYCVNMTPSQISWLYLLVSKYYFTFNTSISSIPYPPVSFSFSFCL